MTPTTLDHPLVRDYLRALSRAASALPARERDDLLTEIREHLAAGLDPSLGAGAADGTPSEARVRNLLDDLGEPEDIVAAAGPVARTRGAGPLEVIAVIFLLVGAIIVPFVGWFVGVALLWASSAWPASKKALGTLVLPFGLAAPLILGLMSAPVVLPRAAGVLLLVVLLVAPVAVAAVLLQSARRPAK